VDEDTCKDFAENVEESPELRCCTTVQFQIDIHGGAQSPWNTSAALVFVEDFIKTKDLPMDRSDNILKAFYTRLKSIKQSFKQTPRNRMKKATYLRKYTVRVSIGFRVITLTHISSALPEATRNHGFNQDLETPRTAASEIGG
jgi:hypothetical protein